MRMIKFALCAALIASMPMGTAFAEDYVRILQGDLNGDGVVNVSDCVKMSSYIHGRENFSQAQFIAGDLNGDGSVDSLDLAGMKFILISNLGRIPVGTWIVQNIDGRDYYYFDGKGGLTITNEQSGAVTENTVTVSENKLTVTGESGTRDINISWVNKNRFALVSDSGLPNEAYFYGSQPIYYDQLLNGEWASDKGRTYNIKGVYGYYRDGSTDNTDGFVYRKELNRVSFDFGNGETKNGFITGVDSMHIDLTWEDGTVERLTQRNIEVRDGITYVNGILIANKTYALPSDYAPNGILPEAQQAFNEMKAAARKDGLYLDICSGYRSYAYQRDLYNSYVNRDGKAAADTYSARAGHSEHQTGLAMDINMASDAFSNTPEAKWLAAHCAEYGFIIRYPKGKQDITGYKYESWHVRYLGKQLAQEVTASGLTLEEFLCIDSRYQ